MDGVKLDEVYKEKNGYGPSMPETKKPTAARALRPTSPKTSDDSEEVGFVDRILQEKDAPKKVKKPKPVKEPKKLAPAPKPKPQPVEPPKPPKTNQPQPQKQSAPKKVSSTGKSKIATLLKVIIIGGLVAFSVYNFVEIRRLNDLMDNSQVQQGQNETKNKELVEKIGSLMRLPDGNPEVYTVKDKNKLVDDLVFKYAENGDKVVVYPDDSLTIVYRESDSKIIDSSRGSSLADPNSSKK